MRKALPGPLLVVGAEISLFLLFLVFLYVERPVFLALFLGGAVGSAIVLSRLPLVKRWIEAVDQAFRTYKKTALMTLLLLILSFPFMASLVFRSPYWVVVATIAGIFVCLSLGLNITVGLAGLLDLGYIAFFGIGAYTSALVSLHFPEHWYLPWLMMPGVAVIAALSGVIIGSPTLRLRGDYLAVVTLGFGQIIRIIFNNWDSVTNGPKGLSGIPAIRVGTFSFSSGMSIWGLNLSDKTFYYFLTVFFAFLIYGVAKRLDNSRIGRAWRAIREDEIGAACAGVDVRAMKLIAFACGASFSGAGGLIFAHMQTFIDPMSFGFIESAFVLCMVVLGGMGSIPGVVTGAIVLSILPEKLREFEDYRMLLFGLCLVIVMVLRPQGLIPRRHS